MATTRSSTVADRDYLVRSAAISGHQAASLLIPPVYATIILVKRGRGALSVNSLLRTTWIGGLGGAAAGVGIGYAWYSSCKEELLRSKRVKAAYNNDRIRANDHATIGSVLFCVLTPALLWRRANIVNLIFGGAGLGSSVGLLIHHGRSLMGDPPPKFEAPDHAE